MGIRDKVLDYLIKSNFVTSYVKKLMFPSDIDDLYEDYCQEVWLALCEVSEEKWKDLYFRRANQDEFYDIRNWVSVIIRNTVKSTTSSAFRKLKKQATIADMKTTEEWKYLSNTVADENGILDTIRNT